MLHFLRSALRQLRAPRGGARRPALARPCVDALEDRTVPAFLAPVSYAGGVEAPRVADVNGDGRADVVVIDRDGGTVSVFLGNGDGTLRAAQTSAAGTAPSSFTVGDFNGDGRLDVVTANQRDLSLLLGRGDGSFLAPRSLSLPKVGRDAQDPRSVAAGDLDGDGQLDLVVVGQTLCAGRATAQPEHVSVVHHRGGCTDACS